MGRFIFAAFALPVLTACQTAPPPEMSGTEAIQELTPLFESYTAGIVGDNLEAVTTLYASDPVEMGPGDYRDYDGIVADYGFALRGGTFTVFDIEPFDAWVQGEVAYSISRVHISYEIEGQDTFVQELYSFMRLVKEDGEWRIHRNVYGPVDAPEEG